MRRVNEARMSDLGAVHSDGKWPDIVLLRLFAKSQKLSAAVASNNDASWSVVENACKSLVEIFL